MTPARIDAYRRKLDRLAAQLEGTVEHCRDEALRPIGAEPGGISDAPVHPSDPAADAGEQEVELALLENVLYVGRPVHGQPEATIGLFKVLATGEAERVPVKLGRTSVSVVEIIEGLDVGDEVVLSDMSQWDEFSRIKLR